MHAIVILNEQHSLMEQQVEVLQEHFDTYEILQVPEKGWTLEEIYEVAMRLRLRCCEDASLSIVHASVVPALLKETLEIVGRAVIVFHNDKREKVQRGDAIFYRVAKTGWQLV